MQGQASTARRDELLRYQKEAQKRWQEDKLFEVDAPAEGQKTPPAVLITTQTSYANQAQSLHHLGTN